MSRPAVVLVGVMGAGKTTIGQLLSERLGKPLRDTDDDIVEHAGKPISDIFVDDGEDHFRALERAAVAKALEEHDGILALGGGAILAPETRELLKSHRVVHLEVGLSDAASRVGLGVGRPLLAINPRATLKHLLDQRRPFYDEVASITVTTNGRTPDDIVEEILKGLKQLICRRERRL
jgi:shikimate kinase